MQRVVREYSPLTWKNCPIKTPMMIQMTIPKSNINMLTMSGMITANEEVSGEIEFSIDANKCSMDMKICEKYPGVTVREMCKKFKTKGAFYSSTFLSMKPPMQCPIKPGNYTMGDISIDLSVLSVLPLDGYIWVVNFKFLSVDGVQKTKKIAMCLNSETKISRTSRRSSA